MKEKRVSLLVQGLSRLLVIWLGLALGCKQASPLEMGQLNQPGKMTAAGPVAPTTTPTTCDDGTCCGQKGVYYGYRETISGDTILLRGNTVTFSKPIPTGTSQQWATTAEVCTLTAAPVDKVIYSVFGSGNYNEPIRCKIWGRIYTADKITTVTGVGPIRYFAVDRLEVMK